LADRTISGWLIVSDSDVGSIAVAPSCWLALSALTILSSDFVPTLTVRWSYFSPSTASAASLEVLLSDDLVSSFRVGQSQAFLGSPLLSKSGWDHESVCLEDSSGIGESYNLLSSELSEWSNEAIDSSVIGKSISVFASQLMGPSSGSDDSSVIDESFSLLGSQLNGQSEGADDSSVIDESFSLLGSQLNVPSNEAVASSVVGESSDLFASQLNERSNEVDDLSVVGESYYLLASQLMGPSSGSDGFSIVRRSVSVDVSIAITQSSPAELADSVPVKGSDRIIGRTQHLKSRLFEGSIGLIASSSLELTIAAVSWISALRSDRFYGSDVIIPTPRLPEATVSRSRSVSSSFGSALSTAFGSSADQAQGKSSAAIIGGAVGGLAGLVILAGVVLLLLKFRSHGQKSPDPEQDADSHELAEDNIVMGFNDWSEAVSEFGDSFSHSVDEGLNLFDPS
jgi:hypothetical protein